MSLIRRDGLHLSTVLVDIRSMGLTGAVVDGCRAPPTGRLPVVVVAGTISRMPSTLSLEGFDRLEFCAQGNVSMHFTCWVVTTFLSSIRYTLLALYLCRNIIWSSCVPAPVGSRSLSWLHSWNKCLQCIDFLCLYIDVYSLSLRFIHRYRRISSSMET